MKKKNCRCTDNSTCGVTSCGRKPSGHCSGGQYDLQGRQDDEDTQSDEAEAEAEEEQSEESQSSSGSGGPASSYRDTEGRKKRQKKKTQKREAAENSSDSTSSDEKTLLKKAKKLAQQYDYTGAISVLKNNWKFATSDKMQEAAAAT